MAQPNIAPVPQFPERTPNTYERSMAPAQPMNRGPLRFEEGVATDTDVPSDFQVGMMQGYMSAPGRANHNANVYEKAAAETMAQRAHVGSAAWVEAPTFLQEFATGSFTDYGMPRYEEVIRNGGHQARMSPTVIVD